MNNVAPALRHASSAPAALRTHAHNIRRNVLLMARGKGEGYVGQGLGAADIMAVAYFHAIRFDGGALDQPIRDRFILSTGHYSIALYAALVEAGVHPVERLSTYGADESPFGMSTVVGTAGVEVTGGSLGQGLSQAIGFALGARLAGRDARIVNFLSDGELQEGSTWEAAMSAAHHRIDNLLAFVDVNGVQADGKTTDVLSMEPIDDKWRAFGWHVARVDGNSLDALVDAVDQARTVRGRPQVIVCDTEMGNGVPFIAARPRGHFVRVDTGEWDRALAELEQGQPT